jgi:hypothetical protein
LTCWSLFLGFLASGKFTALYIYMQHLFIIFNYLTIIFGTACADIRRYAQKKGTKGTKGTKKYGVLCQLIFNENNELSVKYTKGTKI